MGTSIQYVVETKTGRELTVIAPNRDGAAVNSIGPGRDVSLAWDPPTHSSSNDRRPPMPHDDLDGIVERMLDGSEHSRRQFIRHLAGAGLLIGPGSAFLAACGGVKGESSGKKASAVVSHPKVPIGDWTFSNWPLYIDKSVLKSFDKKYGGHVKYVEDINDNFEFFGKVRQQLQAKRSIGRDIVTLTDYMAARWVRDGFVTAIDKKNVPNAKNLVSNLQSIGYDPKRNFTLPWQSGAIGIGYDKRKTGRKLNSIKDFFDPKFKGRVSFLSEPYDSAGMVMLMDGVDSTHATLDQIMTAIDKIEKAQKAGQIRRFTGNDYTTDLTKGNLWSRWPTRATSPACRPTTPPRVRLPDEGR